MKLIYRGVTYDYNPEKANADRLVQPMRQSPYKLIYRGNRYRVDPTIDPSTAIAPCNYKLMYRGNTYQVTRSESGEMIAISDSTKFGSIVSSMLI